MTDTSRFKDNVTRVRNLLSLFEQIGAGKQGRRPTHATDVLRAATVLLHASLEEFVSGLARERLPNADINALNNVPLVGTGPRLERISLGQLAPYKEQSVGRLIEDSVSEHLDRSNWNNPGDLKKMLQSLGLNVAELDIDWDSLGRLMARRHQIVHQADRNPKVGVGQPKAEMIAVKMVRQWTEDVEHFVDQVAERL